MQVITHCPELYEILQHGGGNEQTVHQRVRQEEDEELVVGESDTVVHPGDAQTKEEGLHMTVKRVVTPQKRVTLS